MEELIIDVRNSVSKLVDLSKQKYVDEKTELNRITYETQNKIYNELKKIESLGQMVRFSNALIALSNRLQKEYLQEKTKFEREKDESIRNKLYSKILIQVYMINAYNETIKLINNHLNKYYGNNKSAEAPKINNSKEIIDLLIKQKSLDPSSKEAQELEITIYNKRVERQVQIESLISSKAGKYIFEIESLELRCSLLKNIKDIDGEYKPDKYIDLFEENIKIINEYEFKKEKTNDDVLSYNQAIRNVKNLLLSLGLAESFVNEFIMDLIKFNLSGDYHEFELHNGLGYSRKNYISKINEIKEKIKSIKGNVIRKGKIKVSNRLETYDELIKQINNTYEDINKEYVESLGGISVHR